MDILNGKRLILGSKSPRRDELLTMAGLAHEIFVTDADESVVVYHPGEPERYVEELSKLKADSTVEALGEALRDGVILTAHDLEHGGEYRSVVAYYSYYRK